MKDRPQVAAGQDQRVDPRRGPPRPAQVRRGSSPIDGQGLLGRLDPLLVEPIRGVADPLGGGGELAAGGLLHADRECGELADVTVRGGGQIKGKLIPDKAHPGKLLYIGEVGKTPMVFTKDQIVQVTPEKSALDEYVVRLAKDRPTAEAEYELGLWCEEHKLADLAQVHYDLTLKRDSTFEAAHQKLGHVLMGGRWLNADEVKEAQGMVKFKGRWMTPEEKERRDMLASTAAENSTWVKKVSLLRNAYLAGPIERSKDAERRLLAIEEPVAIGPVLKVLGDDPIPGLRALASKVLGSIPGPEASSALVGRLLGEEDQDVRQETMNQLTIRDSAEVVPLLTRGLRSSFHQVVNRSAWGLGNLNAVAAVPKLIPVLITYEYEVMMVDAPPAGGPGGFVAGANAAGFSSYSSRSIPILTPPAIGPGSIAYGATSIPTGPFNGPTLVNPERRRLEAASSGAVLPSSVGADRAPQRRGPGHPGQIDRCQLWLRHSDLEAMDDNLVQG